jgi:hypothetical protein
MSVLRLISALSGLLLAVSAAMAQNTQDGKPQAPAVSNANPPPAAPDSGAKPAKKVQNTPAADTKPKPGQYATESEAKAHCRGTVVWVDNDHFNHYAGSREYGRKPGAFACESG